MEQKKEIREIRQRFDRRPAFLFSACVLLNEDIYSVTNIDTLPVKVNLHTGEMSYIVCGHEKEFVNSEDIISHGNEMLLLEQNGHRMMRFNIKNNSYQYYNISCHKKEWGNYAAYAKYKNYIYIFPKYMNHIIKIDLETDLIETDLYLYMEVENLYKETEAEENFVYFGYGLQSNNIVWLFQNDRKEVYAYDLDAEDWKKYNLPLDVSDCVHVVIKDNIFYILSSEGKLYTWNIKKDDMQMIADIEVGSRNNTFSRIAVTDKKIFMLPAMENDIYWIDIINGTKGLYNDYPCHFEYCAPYTWAKYSGYCEDQDYYYFAMRSSMFILCINKNNSALEWLKVSVPSDRENFRMHYKDENLFYENQWSLKEVLEYVENKVIINKRHDNVGNRIWNFIKKI